MICLAMVERKPENKSFSMLGEWRPVEGEPGYFTTEKAPQSFITSEFSEFAEASRARWDFAEFIKVKISQYLRKRVSK